MELKQCLILGYSPLLLLNQNHSLYFNWYPLNYEAFPLWMMSLFISLWEVKALFPIIFWGIILVLWPGEFFICVYWLAVSWILWWIFLQNSAVSIPYSSILSSILFSKFFSVVLPQLIFLTSGKQLPRFPSPLYLYLNTLSGRKLSNDRANFISNQSLMALSPLRPDIPFFKELFFLCFVLFLVKRLNLVIIWPCLGEQSI